MAKVEIKMPEELLLELSKLAAKTDELVPKVLAAGAEVVLAEVKIKLRAVVGQGTKQESKSTGELAASLGISSVKLDRDNNHNVKVGFSEPRSDGGSNAKLANILEYGKSGQAPKPFLKQAKAAARKNCLEAMQMELEKELSSL